ncbi:MAG: nicotinate-nucleotide adenylyltransferase [Firmicutes bacterium]|nr:nicotinate-nucleotide adenylyltransferase [Bacillota bacterium]MCL2256411.1 nicotinate-nucleotide adenylyltransferase [Bacillota bacterium]
MEYLIEGLKRSDWLIAGITNYDLLNVVKNLDLTNTRMSIQSNLFTFYERFVMIKESLLESGVGLDKFEIVPFPIERVENIRNFVSLDAIFYVTIYDDWGKEKLKILQNLEVETEVMWEKTIRERLTSGTEIRKITANEKWEHLVSKTVFDYITKNKLDKRIRSIF